MFPRFSFYSLLFSQPQTAAAYNDENHGAYISQNHSGRFIPFSLYCCEAGIRKTLCSQWRFLFVWLFLFLDNSYFPHDVLQQTLCTVQDDLDSVNPWREMLSSYSYSLRLNVWFWGIVSYISTHFIGKMPHSLRYLLGSLVFGGSHGSYQRRDYNGVIFSLLTVWEV